MADIDSLEELQDYVEKNKVVLIDFYSQYSKVVTQTMRPLRKD